jgi:hypothetical protein
MMKVLATNLEVVRWLHRLQVMVAVVGLSLKEPVALDHSKCQRERFPVAHLVALAVSSESSRAQLRSATDCYRH